MHRVSRRVRIATIVASAACLVPVLTGGQIDLETIRHGTHYLFDSDGRIEVGTPNFQVGDTGTPAQAKSISHNFAVFDLAGVSPGSILAAEFVVFMTINGYFSADPTETYTMFRFDGDPADLVNLQSSPAMHVDLGSGPIVGESVMDESMEGLFVTIPITAAGLADLNTHAGGLWAFGGKLTTPDTDPVSNEMVFTLNIDRPPSAYRLVLIIGSPCPGDTDLDGDVDLADLNLVLFNFGSAVLPGTRGDLDASGTVDLTDLNEVLFHFGVNCI